MREQAAEAGRSTELTRRLGEAVRKGQRLICSGFTPEQLKNSKKIERLLVGWGGTIWIVHVHPGAIGTGRNAGERSAGRAEIVKMWVCSDGPSRP